MDTLVPGAMRAEFVQGRPGSKTPWNVMVIAPRADHMTHETAHLGCGFYRTVHQAEDGDLRTFRKAFCRGYGLKPGASHATTIELRAGPVSLSEPGGFLELRIGSLVRAKLVRAP